MASRLCSCPVTRAPFQTYQWEATGLATLPTSFLQRGFRVRCGALVTRPVVKSSQVRALTDQPGHSRGFQLSERQTVPLRAASVEAAVTLEPSPAVRQSTAVEEGEDDTFACPICHNPLIRFGPKGAKRQAVEQSKFRCQRCQRAFPVREGYLDLVMTSGMKEYQESLPVGTELFRSPFVSFLYERGWRQNFASSGFPGPNEEFQMAQRYLQPAKGGLLLDVSCGSGLFSRRFMKSRDYSCVIASDFSENMLRQTRDFINQDSALSDSNAVLVRADVARLPFSSGSVDAVHAGAAMHCWPSPSLAVAEISRILKPGGVFVATTFLAPRAPFADELVKPIRQALANQRPASIKMWEVEELEELCRVCGLVDYRRDVRRNFIMLSARKHLDQ